MRGCGETWGHDGDGSARFDVDGWGVSSSHDDGDDERGGSRGVVVGACSTALSLRFGLRWKPQRAAETSQWLGRTFSSHSSMRDSGSIGEGGVSKVGVRLDLVGG